MFRVIVIFFYITTSSFSFNINDENLKNYPLSFKLDPLKIENNMTIGEKSSIYKNEIKEYSQDGILWFDKLKKDKWHINIYSKPEVYITDKLFKLEVKTPLLNYFDTKLELNTTKYLYKEENKEREVYLLEDTIKIDIKKEGNLVIKHRVIMDDSLSSHKSYFIKYKLDNNAEIIQKFNPPADIISVKTLDSKEFFMSVEQKSELFIPKNIKSVEISFDTKIVGNIYYQSDINDLMFYDKNITKIKPSKQQIKMNKIDNRFENSSYKNYTDFLKQIKDKYYFSSYWSKNFNEAIKDIPYRQLYPTTSSSNLYFKSGYFIPKIIKTDDKKISYSSKWELDYLTKINSGIFIGTKKDKKNYLKYQLPKRDNHLVRISILDTKKKNIQLFIDDKLYGTLKISDKNISIRENVTLNLTNKYKSYKTPFIWYKNNKELLNTTSIELFIKKGESLSFKTKKGKIPAMLVEIRDSKELRIDENTAIKLFSLPKEERASIVKKALFFNGEFTNLYYPLIEILTQKSKLFEKNIDKDTKYKLEDINLIKKLANKDLTMAIKIAKFFIYKNQNPKAIEFLTKLYNQDDINLIYLKSKLMMVNKNLNEIGYFKDYFYRNSFFNLALLSAIAQEISPKSYKIAEKLKMFELSEYLKSRLNQKIKSENIWGNIADKVTTSTSLALIKNQKTAKKFMRFVSSDKKRVTLLVQGPTYLKIESRSLITDENSNNSWLKIDIDNKIYNLPIYGSLKSQNLIIENIKGGVGIAKYDFISLGKGEHKITVSSDLPMLLGFFEQKIDFKNRFNNSKNKNLSKKILNLKSKISNLVYKYETTKITKFGIEATYICNENRDKIDLEKICRRVSQNFEWKKFENFSSIAGIIREEKVSTFKKDELTILKHKLFDKPVNKLLSSNKKFIYNIFKTKPYVTIDIQRVSYRYYKQSHNMKVYIKVSDKEYKIILKDGESKKIKIPLKDEVTDLQIYIQSDDIATFANIIMDEKSINSIYSSYLTTPKTPIIFSTEQKDFYKIYFDDTEVKYYFIDKGKRDITLNTNKNQKVTIYKMQEKSVLPVKKMIFEKEFIEQKEKFEIESIDIFEKRDFEKAKIKNNKPLDSYSIFYQRRDADDELNNNEYEEFLQINKEIISHYDLFSLGVNIFGRKHIKHDSINVFGMSAKLFYPISDKLSVEGIIDAKIQNDDHYIASLYLNTRYKIFTTPKDSLSFKFTGFLRKVPDAGYEYIDSDIYTDYKKDHQYGLKLLSYYSYMPYKDTKIFNTLAGTLNENLSIDNIEVNIGIRQLFTDTEGYLKLNLKQYFEDEDRDDLYLRKKINLGLSSRKWFNSKRGEVFANLSYDIDKKDYAIKVGFKFDFNQDSSYSKSYPNTTHFKKLKELIDWRETYEY